MRRTITAAFLLAWPGLLLAGAANTSTALDSGGRRATSANYSQTVSLGSMGTAVSQSQNTIVTVKPGFIGRLYNVTGEALLRPASLTVPETQSVQIKAFARLDDHSLIAIPSVTLANNTVLWISPSPSKLSINQGGLAVASAVYQDETGVQIAAVWNGYTAELPTPLTILNSNTDNFAPYNADSIDDAWQVLHFGLNNPVQGRSDFDPDGDGTSNLMEWSAGTDPLSSASKLGFITFAMQPSGMFEFTFSSVIGRSYHIERSTDLASWTLINTVNATESITAYTDNATPAGKVFYRIAPVPAP